MTFAEHFRYPADDQENPPLVDVLMAERDRVGSTRNYVYSLGVSYEANPETQGNMLQLQRMAQLVTNPSREPSHNKRLTDAFYWGEVVAYSAGDTHYGAQWSELSYKLFNNEIRDDISTRTQEQHTSGPISRQEYLQQMYEFSEHRMDVLWRTGEGDDDDEDKMLPVALESLISDWADDLADDASEQLYIIMGFRHVMMQTLVRIERDETNCIILDDAEKLRDTTSDVEQQSLDKINKEFMKIIGKNIFEEPIFEGEIEEEAEPKAEEVSLDDVKIRLTQDMVKYRATYLLENPDYTATDTAQTLALASYLAVRMNEEFSRTKGIDRGEEVIVRGEIVYLAIDDETGKGSYERLSADNRLEGHVEMLLILPSPVDAQAVHADQRGEQPGAFDVALVLKRPFLADDNDQYRLLDGNSERVAIILNSQQTILSKYIS